MFWWNEFLIRDIFAGFCKLRSKIADLKSNEEA